MRMASGMNTHSIAAAAHSFDLFATRICMPTPMVWQGLVFVANAAPTVAPITHVTKADP
jgi:hypothetical protein